MADKERFVGKEIKRLNNCICRSTELSRSAECSEGTKTCDDISASNSWLIMYLYDHLDEDVFQRDIEQEFSIRRSTSSNIITLLEKKGYIERVLVERDARLRKLVLTPKALEQCDLIAKNMIEFEKKLVKGISKEELDAFYSTLDKMVANIKR